MADYIPFIISGEDYGLFKEYYSDCTLVRVPLHRHKELLSKVSKLHVWVDAELDGFDSVIKSKTKGFDEWANTKWRDRMATWGAQQCLAGPSAIAKPSKAQIRDVVFKLLDTCATHEPSYISVPQLPFGQDGGRNKVNRLMAESAGEWRSKYAPKIGFVLPAIFTNQDQLNQKTARNSRLNLISDCRELSRAELVWAVDSSLSDQDCTKTFRTTRFPGIVAMHTELKALLPASVKVVAGPYWGMNLVLWARGLCEYPAIGIGRGFQYHSPSGIPGQAKARVAIPPLRRWAVTGSGLSQWLDATIKHVSTQLPAHAQFVHLRSTLSQLMSSEQASRRQIAGFYRDWYCQIESADKKGRALALYQDLSQAYILGKALDSIPTESGLSRHPELVAEFLMMSCL